MEEQIKQVIEKFKKGHGTGKIASQEGNFSSLIYGTAYFSLFSSFYKRYYDFDFKPCLAAFGNKTGMAVYGDESYRKASEFILKRFLLGDKEIMGYYQRLFDEARRLYLSSSPEKIKELTLKELKDSILVIYHKIFEAQIATLFCEAVDDAMLKDYFEKIDQDKTTFEEFMKYVNIHLFVPFIKTINVKSAGEDDDYPCQWIFSDYSCTPELGDIYRLRESMIKSAGGKEIILNENRRLEEEIRKNSAWGDDFRKNLDHNTLELFDFAQSVVRMRDERKELFFRLTTMVSNLAEEIFERLNLSKEDRVFAFYNDFSTGIYNTEIYRNLIERRKKGFVAYYDNDGVQIFYNDYSELKNLLYSIKDNTIRGELKGSIASRGFAKGKVKVILSNEDFHKFEDGDILVTSMTRPEFVPILGKAAAIVTDEGGITCHAAIISREMKIPCVTGTERATRVLKEGDWVEVDANEGIIRILERK